MQIHPESLKRIMYLLQKYFITLNVVIFPFINQAPQRTIKPQIWLLPELYYYIWILLDYIEPKNTSNTNKEFFIITCWIYTLILLYIYTPCFRKYISTFICFIHPIPIGPDGKAPRYEMKAVFNRFSNHMKSKLFGKRHFRKMFFIKA